MRTVANRVIWFESAEEALRYPERFLAHLMTYGTLEEILIARKYFSDRNLNEPFGMRRREFSMLRRGIIGISFTNMNRFLPQKSRQKRPSVLTMSTQIRKAL